MPILTSIRYFSVAAVCFLTASTLAAQEPLLEKLVHESALLRHTEKTPESKSDQAFAIDKDRSVALRDALRDWVESHLPPSRATLDSDVSALQSKLEATLNRSGLLQGDGSAGYGYISRVEIARPPEYSEGLNVILGVTVPCGFEDSVYLYDYSQGPRNRVLESYSSRPHDESITDVYFSDPDELGSHLILTV